MESSGAAADDLRPRFSLVSAVYNVERYLGEFIESVEAQTFPLERVEVIMVDDGSTDGSLEVLQAWQERRPGLVRVISKANGGQATARNAAFEYVTGEWVSFTDPDDTLDPGFLKHVDAFLTKYPETELVATKRIMFSDATGRKWDHPLRWHFLTGSNRLRNLDYDTGHFHGHAAGSFFRHDVLEREGIRFDERLRTSFEDGHFCNIYLLRAPEPLVGYVVDAIYNYRKRDDGSSTLDRSWQDPGRFTDVPEHGFLDLLRAGAERRGRPPTWLQGMVIYELYWYFRTNDRMSAATAAHGETQRRFHEIFEQICALLDDVAINSYRGTPLKPVWREILLRGTRNERWHTSFAIADKLDEQQRLMRVTYRFTGELPDEMFIVSGKVVEPVHQKIRDVHFFERTLLHERIVWLPFGALRVVIDGRDLDVRSDEPAPPSHVLRPSVLQEALDPAAQAAAGPKPRKLTRADKRVLRLAGSAAVRRQFQDAWVLIDRIYNADDSAEHLFWYLRQHRPSVNAWFVIQRGSPDFKRLRRSRVRGRVVAHGSLRWKLLMLNAQHLISSHADDIIIKPRAIRRLADPSWRLTFLQHGVTKDDLSTWLNGKNIEILVTSTPGEQESIAGDHTTYRYTTREAKLIGLPRFDRILAESNRIRPEERDLILVAPTWRQWLTSADKRVGRHSVDPEQFAASEFATQWTAFLHSPELRDLAERTGLTLAVLLHPNLEANATLETPSYVQRFGFEGQSVQRLFARSRVLVTDYSSMFFNAAYIERPIVYFQFDRDRMLSGAHVGRRGYFDYEQHGFGPVTLTVDDAVAATVKSVENGPEPDPVYLARINESFPNRDGRCCERAADAIAESTLRADGVRTRTKKTDAKPRPTVLARRIARRVVRQSPQAQRLVARVRARRRTRA